MTGEDLMRAIGEISDRHIAEFSEPAFLLSEKEQKQSAFRVMVSKICRPGRIAAVSALLCTAAVVLLFVFTGKPSFLPVVPSEDSLLPAPSFGVPESPPPMIMVNGKIYLESGAEDKKKVNWKTLHYLGEVTRCTENEKAPSFDFQTNFEGFEGFPVYAFPDEDAVLILNLRNDLCFIFIPAE